ncbi:MAG: HAMP domain-containing sensor histidine kinase, partial [Armatimonadota bacterium]|nr:HAMP domain-containing sensor histidine kinase [Armatimonadota bacterium]
RTQFLSLVSHELRSPLTAIKGYVDVVRTTPNLNPEDREVFLRTAAAHCERLKTTVNNVLMAAQMQQEDGWQGDCRPLDLRGLVAQLVEEVAGVEPRRVFEFEAPQSVPNVLADETGTELVLRNLLDNAAKFSLEGSTVRVRVEAGEEEVLVHIGDEGIGISPDQLRAVFEPFYQAEYYRTRRSGGSGLGLYLVREIMERMGGRISVRSELGKGSVFTCVFRVAKEETR